MDDLAKEVLSFWFNDLSENDWFVKNHEIDLMIQEKFFTTLQSAGNGELFHWRGSPQGRVAEIIVLDQFSRNIFRGKADSFSKDPLALILSQELLHSGDYKKLSSKEKVFGFMPLMHSESRLIHDRLSLPVFVSIGDIESLKFERLHKEIIDKFGRYPHRNVAMGRDSTPAELDFMRTHPGF